jgi:type I restriction enzyme, R subunit
VLPASKKEDFSKGILETIEMGSYRIEVQASMDIALPDKDSEQAPILTIARGIKPECELEKLSHIIKNFNDYWGNTSWANKERITTTISEEISNKLSADQTY